ncbi:GNAT family N-acetyltransferase [Loktanella sp. IMCC34160]|uniref:GNAT family N-acetyltransferase n=1 Tax=Loktanella sp. IMCC34160 TaxID=2510646 RepID=UPI00101E01D5|nr:GNAT family N-acetyltransferase [Loktanella sp. IMCC34160]RYG91270.1 GNAT family N-acetyltransferase [Loktanella sp. IMCC34160]
MTEPDVQTLYAVTEATWPAAARVRLGPWTIRTGLGGGQRVSATTADGDWTDDDLPQAEAAMRRLGQPCLFMVRAGETMLDKVLEDRGYRIKDPVNLMVAPSTKIAEPPPPRVTAIEGWPWLAAQAEVWAEGGIGPGRLAVMDRAPFPKTTILGRVDNSPAGAAYAGIHDGVAMFHAVEVSNAYRRRGLGANMIRAIARWALTEGADWTALVVTQANSGANALYASMGFRLVGQYHYRILPE